MRTTLLALVAAALVAPATAGNVRGNWTLGRGPCCLAVVGNELFAGTHRDARLVQIDPATNRIVWKQAVPPQSIDYRSFLAYDGALWITYFNSVNGHVARLDPVTHRQVTVDGVSDPSGAVALDGSLWIGDVEDNDIHRVDPKTARIAGTITVKPVAFTQLAAAAGGSLWLTAWDDTHASLVRVDPRNGKVVARLQPFTQFAEVRTLATIGNALWVSVAAESVDAGKPTLFRIDTSTNEITLRADPKVTGNADTFPAVFAPGDGTLWLQTDPRRLSQIDPTTGATIRTLALPLASNVHVADYWMSWIVAGFGSYWITSWIGQGGTMDQALGSLYRDGGS